MGPAKINDLKEFHRPPSNKIAPDHPKTLFASDSCVPCSEKPKENGKKRSIVKQKIVESSFSKVSELQ